VHALRNIYAALLPDGVLVDTQPISPDSLVEAADGGLGRLDMREWRETIDAVEERTTEASGCESCAHFHLAERRQRSLSSR
jgi:hypothetical protein